MGSVLSGSNVESGVPSVILMDEIQGFRTIDEDGHDIHDCKFKDVWTLLSDGKLPYHVEVESLMSMLWDIQKKEISPESPKKSTKSSDEGPPMPSHMSSDEDDDDDDDDEEGIEGGYTKSFFQLNYFKSLLRLEEPIEEIALWPDAKRKGIIIQRLTDKTIFEEEDYTQCLIFISGNLDEAYGFAKDVKEVDADADILHEMSKKISILDIKEALTQRFKPEQISRMGNTHVIYPSLSRSSFETIIDRKVDAIVERVVDKTGVELQVDPSIKTLIYNNGVFPTQGTRPLFSTISDVLENSLPNCLLKAILRESDQLKVLYQKDAIVGTFDTTRIRRPYIGAIDKLKNDRRSNKDRKTLTSVHEAGHAVAFGLLFGHSPAQIMSTPASNDSEGFVYTLQVCSSRDMSYKRLCVMLAGQAAEKIIFGKENVTSGSGSDLAKATEKASRMIRKWGMGAYASVIARSDIDLANNDQEGSNSMIDSLLQEAKKDVEELLAKNANLLTDVIDNLLIVDKLTPEEFQIIFSNHKIELNGAMSSEEVIYWDYHDAYKEFLKRHKTS